MENKRTLFCPLKSHARFEILKKKGKRINVSPWLMVNYDKSPGETAYGWTVPRYVGPAVVRNKLKRWMREYFRKNQDLFIPLEMQLNLILKRQANNFYQDLAHKDLDENLSKLAQKLRG